MIKLFLTKIQTWKWIIFTAVVFLPLIYFLLGRHGIVGGFLSEIPWWGFVLYYVLATHITITAMSLSFHRHHTHHGVILHPIVDSFFQMIVWVMSSLTKREWVAIHIVHHKYSDKNMDLHSPVLDGFWHTFFLGVYDYKIAKKHPEVMAVEQKIPLSSFEKFLEDNKMLGAILLTAVNIFCFGPLYGSLISLLNYSIVPLFAVGGVNALAHTIGYKNHKTSDNSRNIGFIYILDWLICGELNHNNHHARINSCSFRHRWFELDIGYVYLKILSFFRLAEIKNVYSREKFKLDIGRRAIKLLEENKIYIHKCRELAKEMNMDFHQVREMLIRYFEGKKVKLNSSLKKLKKEILEQVHQHSYIISSA